MDRHTPEQRKKNMQAVKNKDSKIEKILRKELWAFDNIKATMIG